MMLCNLGMKNDAATVTDAGVTSKGKGLKMANLNETEAAGLKIGTHVYNFGTRAVVLAVDAERGILVRQYSTVLKKLVGGKWYAAPEYTSVVAVELL